MGIYVANGENLTEKTTIFNVGLLFAVIAWGKIFKVHRDKFGLDNW